MVTPRSISASLRAALPTAFVLMVAVATSGCSEAETPTATEPPEAEVLEPAAQITPQITCENGQTFVTICLNPLTSPQTVALPIESARRLVVDGAWIGPCPGDELIDRCPR